MPPAKPPSRRSSAKAAAPTRASLGGGKAAAAQGADSARKAAPAPVQKVAANTVAPKGQAKPAASSAAPRAQAKQAAGTPSAKGAASAQPQRTASARAPKDVARPAAKPEARPQPSRKTPRVGIQAPDLLTTPSTARANSEPAVEPGDESREAPAARKARKLARPALSKVLEDSEPAVESEDESGAAPSERKARALTRPALSKVLEDSEPVVEPEDESGAAPSERKARALTRPALSKALEESEPTVESGDESREAPAERAARKHLRPSLAMGALDGEVLPISALLPVQGTFMGAPLLVHANPETVRTSGVLGSTMGRTVPGKIEGGYTFSSQARLFLRAVNRVGETFAENLEGRRVQSSPPEGPQRCSVVVRNTSGRPIHLDIKGGLFSKYLTPQFPRDARGEPFNPHHQEPLDEDVTGLVSTEQGKVPDPRGLFFRGPSAVLASGLMDSHLDLRSEQEREAHPLLRDDLDLSRLESVRLGTRGTFEGRLTVKPGATALVLEARHEKAGTLCALVNFTAVDARGQVDPGARFRVATVSSPLTLTAEDLAAIARGDYPLATSGDDESLLTIAAFPPRQGVLEAGSVFVGGRTLRLSRGDVDGDLVMSMPHGHSGLGADVGTLTPTTRSETSRTPRTCDGGRGVSYELAYTLENQDPEPCEVELLLTSPRQHPEEQFFPQAGVLNLAMKVDGQRVDVRVNQRGEGRVLAVLELPPEGRRQVRIEWTHVGGTFPPAGLEWRVRR
ncbi:hypothetical protein [Myxococcus stipitatus]|uniref:hypothetical protein n=1 Tax=Myxococcus stipitatus TaxID=83455 RepID=UPI0030CBE0E2